MNRVLAKIILALLIFCLPELALAQDLKGKAERLNDADEFFFCSPETCFSIRLCGIDTPSKNQPGYERSIAGLGNLILDKQIICRPVGDGSVCDGRTERISDGRLVAQCFVGKAVDVAGDLVERGLACDRADRSGGYYSKDHPERLCAR